ncbi:helix-hairpin-helix domain-containing protein [Echinicola sp. CAU 1574]|uniref:Helix-hairpin-helix domain-containing protein n=1 Tax=Echinicola arenosa TaxID=2774144 RepID=A0ABR9APV5_9BACT|nr:helix-hairpin-helix domain-containing protein [Echinicola arenosa]MBD8490371.1 helix-hairpin-helix domain-containing protein [Echinicola arenosa]
MKRSFFYFLKSYFGFSQREARGFTLVIPFILFTAFLPIIWEAYQRQKLEADYKSYLALADSLLLADMEIKEEDSVVKKNSFTLVSTPSKEQKDTNRWRKAATKNPVLNKISFAEADSSVLQIVPGIGEKLAGRIVKFRESLGGLYYREQIMEVYGLDEEVAKRVFDYFTFEPSISHKLDINAASAKELSAHPYIKYGEAKVLVAYREQHGNYQSPEDILTIKIFSEEWVNRLKPYLSF